MAACVPFLSNEAVETLVPRSRRLFQSIQRFLQLAYHILLACSFEPHRLSYIYLMIKIVMEKSGLYIELVKVQLILCYQRQQIRIDEYFITGENTSL